uniref:Uncharacterized protein n=1 Tax=Caulobacter sp. (strain K31) TaxID=366602 RepID=B0T9I2_CAUSK
MTVEPKRRKSASPPAVSRETAPIPSAEGLNLFPLALRTVVIVALFSGGSVLAMTIYGAGAVSAETWTRFLPAIDTFKQTWCISVGALVGLLGGKALR